MSNIEKESNLKILGIKEICDILPFGKTKIMELIHAGEIPVVKVGRDYITTEKKLENWIEENIGEELYYR